MRNNLIILATSVLLFGMVLGVMGPGVAYAAPAAANHGVVINEIRIDQPSSDNDEYFELIGPVGASLDDMTYIVIGDGPGGSGVVEAVVDLDGNAIPARGYFVAAESSFTLGTADLITDLNFENSDNVTHLLVKDFEGEKNDDLDTNDDGLLDVTPWSEIVDLIALIEEQNPPSGTEFHYGPPSLGPDYKYVPGHAYRCPSWWEIGEYDPVGVTDTPGEANECPDLLTIMEIQGDGQWSPYQWDFVTTSGVVTMISGDHFWFQDPEGDSDNSTSDGIYVYRGKRYLDLIVGDKIYITARVKEYVSSSRPTDLPLTELEFVTSIMIESYGHTLPEPVELEDVPNVSIPEGIDFYESLEGMLVYLRNAPVVSGTSYYGEFAVLAKDDAKPGSGFYPQMQQILLQDLGGGNVDYNPERVLIDDTTLGSPIDVMPGDRVRHLTGVMDYTFSNYKIQPAEYEVKTHKLPNLPASTRSGPNGNTTITTFNVQNLFPDSPDRKFEKLMLAIYYELELPEIIIVQEVESESVLQDLGDRVNARAGTDYVATSFDTSDVRGIEVGFLWDRNRVSLEDAYQMSGPDVDDAFGPGSPSPGREPIVGVFEVEGRLVTIVGNHFKSKFGDDPLFGQNQPPIRITEEQRKAQAQVVRDFVSEILDADPDALVMVVGDLNDFQFGEPGEGQDHPLAILEGGAGEVPLINLINLEKDAERFTYVYDGNSQVLDHILVSPGLYELFAAVDILHFNASFPQYLEYDASTPLRSSDHDAVEGRFELE